MGDHITLKASDGFDLDVYRAMPQGEPVGAIIVLQEIFGVNSHIRSVADLYATQGYVAYAPALFDRAQKHVEAGYSPEDVNAGVALVGRVPQDKTLLDVQAAIDHAMTHTSQDGACKVGVVGYCWGGSLAYAASAMLNNVSAAVGYYGGNIAGMLDHKPRAPLILFFGGKDDYIPPADIEKIKHANPTVPITVYETTGHGFNCDQRGSYDKPSADDARAKAFAFFKQHIG